MKNVTLIKQHPSIQLAHLYEHLFVRRINEFFYEHELYKNLDYALHGTTFEKAGIVSIEIDFYTKQALLLERQIRNLAIDLGADNSHVSTELARIQAEEPFVIAIGDRAEIITQLHGLDQSPWQVLDDISTIDTVPIRRRAQPLYATNRVAPRTHVLHLKTTLDDAALAKNRSLAAIFNVVSRVYLLTAVNKLCAEFGFYGGELKGTHRPLSTFDSPAIIHFLYENLEISDIKSRCEAVYTTMFTDATIERIADALQATNYRDEIWNTENFERILDETGIVVGAVGWRNLATTDNIRLVLAAIHLDLRLGRQRYSGRLQHHIT